MMYIFGELHTPEDRTRIENEIKRFHKQAPFNQILSEELGPHSWNSKSQMETAIRNEMYSISPRTLELCIELGCKAIGIDKWDDNTYKDDKKGPDGFYTDAKRSFALREEVMCSKISRYLSSGNSAVIVGDTHLRTIETKELGLSSLIQRRFGDNPDVQIIRSPHGEIK